jgi:hypothetical protein
MAGMLARSLAAANVRLPATSRAAGMAWCATRSRSPRGAGSTDSSSYVQR